MGRLFIKRDGYDRGRQQGELLFDDQIRYTTFREQYAMERERRIFLAVLEAGSAGISLVHLVHKLRIDRKIISRYLKKLIQKRLVRRGKGGHGRFFATKQGLEDPSSSATLLGDLFARRLFQNRTLLVQRDMPRNASCIDFTAVPEFAPEKEIEYGLVRSLFEFSNTIGAFITYIIIQSMNPSSIKKYSNRAAQYHVSQNWIDNAISRVIPYLFPVFKEYIELSLSRHFNLQSEEMLDFFVEWNVPSSGYNNKVMEELLHSFGELYPRIRHDLDKIKNDIPEEIESMIHHAEYIKMKKEFERDCTHKFVLVKEPDPSNWYLKHCEKCHYTDFRSRVHRKTK